MSNSWKQPRADASEKSASVTGAVVVDEAAVPRARGGGYPQRRRSRPGSGFGDTEAALRAKTSHSARNEHDRSSGERQLWTRTGPAPEPTYNYVESMDGDVNH